ncbi:hypothetical protein IPL68_03940 [Candidatus Saccharibacteria bacterium]|nr:MAG: hypothetical protein IPL68_03940 [Candidatus Saccharibacteria bacterium]
MVCLYCGSRTEVVNSRPQKRLNQTWRRRKCRACDAIFTTNESIDYSAAIIVKHKAHLESFERDKLLISLAASLGHRTSAVADAAALVATITQKLLITAVNGSVDVKDITNKAYDVLSRFDTLAAAHYSAYHNDTPQL